MTHLPINIISFNPKLLYCRLCYKYNELYENWKTLSKSKSSIRNIDWMPVHASWRSIIYLHCIILICLGHWRSPIVVVDSQLFLVIAFLVFLITIISLLFQSVFVSPSAAVTPTDYWLLPQNYCCLSFIIAPLLS